MEILGTVLAVFVFGSVLLMVFNFRLFSQLIGRVIFSKVGLAIIVLLVAIGAITSSGNWGWVIGISLLLGFFGMKFGGASFIQSKLEINRPMSHIYVTVALALFVGVFATWGLFQWLPNVPSSFQIACCVSICLSFVMMSLHAIKRPTVEVVGDAARVPPEKLAVMTHGLPHTFKIGPITFPAHLEPMHMEIPGASGSGKSNLLAQMMDGIKSAPQQRAIVVDIGGSFVRRYFNADTDIILNDQDERGSPWSPFAEIKDINDCVTMAASFIPTGDGQWKFIPNTAQQILSDIFARCIELGQTTNNDLLYWGMMAEIADLQKFIQGLPGEQHLNPKNTNADKYRSTIIEALTPLRYMDPNAGAASFSIRKWIKSASSAGFIYMTFTEESFKLTGKIVSVWMDIACLTVLGLPETTSPPMPESFSSVLMRSVVGLFKKKDVGGEVEKSEQNPDPEPPRRLWMIIDEFASIGRINSFLDFLEKARKRGGCAIILYQSRSQVEELYGEHARSISTNTNTKFFMSTTDEEDLRRIVAIAGKVKVIKRGKGVSYDGLDSDLRVSEAQTEEDVISTRELSTAPVGTGFMMMKGYPLTYMQFPREKARATNIEPIIQKSVVVHFAKHPDEWRLINTKAKAGAIASAPAIVQAPIDITAVTKEFDEVVEIEATESEASAGHESPSGDDYDPFTSDGPAPSEAIQVTSSPADPQKRVKASFDSLLSQLDRI